MLNQIQLEKIRNYVVKHPGCDLCDIERGLEVQILDHMTQEQFEAECVGVVVKKVDAMYFAI